MTHDRLSERPAVSPPGEVADPIEDLIQVVDRWIKDRARADRRFISLSGPYPSEYSKEDDRLAQTRLDILTAGKSIVTALVVHREDAGPLLDLLNRIDTKVSVRKVWPAVKVGLQEAVIRLRLCQPAPDAEQAVQPDRICINDGTIMLDGNPYTGLSLEAVTVIKELIRMRGRFTSSTDLKNPPHNVGRADRIVKRLPLPIRNIIESQTGRGMRLTVFDRNDLA